MKLSDLPNGSKVFLDANVFVFAFLLINKMDMTELQSQVHAVEQFAKRIAANRITPASRFNATAKPVLTSTTVSSPATVHQNMPQWRLIR